ncbi:hypothetical protein NliqN6_2209 [Naganishia liquefaciens]|uniref:WW domain-containing protein n=1 Tax=Naganishia liquefaciens TaxID=104408 RepID=A0A8H3TRD4_9TREE|nr:hypothetical protein NliqN6_2209 [Naganishia liquefaciens]
MSSQPPTYEAATGGLAPSINTSGPAQQSTSAQSASHHRHGPQHHDYEDDSSEDEMDDDGMLQPLKDDVEARKSMSDEYRELPEGWVRCFDKKSNHQFYVDTKTERSTWLHPYDDPEYLNSLPDTHPANPNSEQARQARAQHEALTKAAQQKKAGSSSGGRQDVHAAAQSAMSGGKSQGNQTAEERSFGGKLKDKILGSTKEERRKAKAEQRERDRKAAEQYLARRKALMEQQANDPRLQGYYVSDPYRYRAPMTPYSRYGGYDLYGPRYGYGGGYGYGYGYQPYGYRGVGMGGMGLGLGAGLLGGSLLGAAMF